jgi:hypothetical protein
MTAAQIGDAAMTCMPQYGVFAAATEIQAASPGARSKPGLLRRLYAAIVESREQRAEREIARILAGSGGRLTDAMERDLMQRLFVNDWSVRR